MKLGFIGCGNMATAIIGGIIKSELLDGKDIAVYDVYAPAVKAVCESYCVTPMESECAVVKACDTVILAVKPNVIGAVLSKINIALDESSTLVISIAAGKDLQYLRSHLSHENRIIRVMPNINAKVGMAMSAYTANGEATNDDKAFCESIFSAVGKIMELDEATFPIFGVIAGCAPAFTYMYIDALARAGVQHGMKKDDALQISAQTVLGSAEMVLESDLHPYELTDKVCSPGGTTVEGVISLQKDGFEAAVHHAVTQSFEKDAKL